MKTFLSILIALLLLPVVGMSATLGHRVLLGRGTIAAPVIVRLAAVRSPFTNGIVDILLPHLDSNYTWTLEASTDLVTWYSKSWTPAGDGWGMVTAAAPKENYRMMGK